MISNFAHTFNFYCLTTHNFFGIFNQSFNLLWMVSFWCKLLCKCSTFTLKSDGNNLLSKIWVGFQLLIFIYIVLQFQIRSHLQNCRLSMHIHFRTCCEEKTFKIFNIISFAILLFAYQNSLTKLLSWVL